MGNRKQQESLGCRLQSWWLLVIDTQSFGFVHLLVITLKCTSNHGNPKTLIKIISIYLVSVETLLISRMVCPPKNGLRLRRADLRCMMRHSAFQTRTLSAGCSIQCRHARIINATIHSSIKDRPKSIG